MTIWIRRFKGVFMAFYRTFRCTQEIIRIKKNKPGAAWNDPKIQQASRKWGEEVLNDFNVKLHIEGEPTQETAIYVGNHISYVDIIALYAIKQLCFVSKSEVGTWPIIGPGTRAAGTISVKRDSAKSRGETAQKLRDAIKNENKSICIFPEGTTSVDGKVWRRGVFKVALENDFLIQPMGFIYTPVRRAAYIDGDTLLPHMWQLIQKDPTLLTVKFFEPRKIHELEKGMAEMENEVRAWLHSQLDKQNYFKSSVGYIE